MMLAFAPRSAPVAGDTVVLTHIYHIGQGQDVLPGQSTFDTQFPYVIYLHV
jgi:hypothetical protein